MNFAINEKDSISNRSICQKKNYPKVLYPILGVLLAFAVFICNFNPVSVLSGAQLELVPVKGELGYKQRSKNRKEGFYEKSTGGSLEVVSLLYGALSFDWNPGVVLEILPPGDMKRMVKIRARAIPLKTYYQMDSSVSPKESLKWPINDVLYKAGLKANMIGVFGWFGRENEKTFVPLKIFQKGKSPTNDNMIFLTVRADVDVEKVICRFSEIVTGKNLKSAEGWKEIGDYINAGHAITVELPDRNSGELCVEIKAKPGSSGTWLPLKITVFYGKTP
ncbi:MAG: hypothetical protein PVH61_16705 [Candidatus Aminicenantes bacterium]